MERFDVLIVGAGHAGAQVAIALRQRGFAGSVVLLGDEPSPPYERPSLSKDYLAGTKSFERLLMRPAAFWEQKRIELRTGQRAVSVDALGHRVGLDDGRALSYGRLVWAAGGRARRLGCPGHDLSGVHAVRDRADVDRILGEMATVRRVVVVGGGYIGLEAAAVLVRQGKNVTVVEALDRVLARVAGEPLSRFYEAEHRARGVDVRLGAKVECLEGGGGRVNGVRLASGEHVAADMVIVGIGIVPNVEPLLVAGAAGGNGVAVDASGRTSLTDVYAVGDCALQRHPCSDGAPVRIESVPNAAETAMNVASTLTGTPPPQAAPPWFWSDQYDLKLQTVGLSGGHDEAVVHGNVEARQFAIEYLRRGRVIAVDCVNDSAAFVKARARLLAAARAF